MIIKIDIMQNTRWSRIQPLVLEACTQLYPNKFINTAHAPTRVWNTCTASQNGIGTIPAIINVLPGQIFWERCILPLFSNSALLQYSFSTCYEPVFIFRAGLRNHDLNLEWRYAVSSIYECRNSICETIISYTLRRYKVQKALLYNYILITNYWEQTTKISFWYNQPNHASTLNCL